MQKDDPKLTALLQKAEPLSSLAITVNTESSKERLDEASKKLQDGSGSAIKDWADSFASPIQKFPGFQSLVDAIPSPKFSESTCSRLAIKN
ncbi:myb-related protein A-like protein [Carex littledalei]|uniref:Myb-related protein A-like protein n=1 Tax=Carex littledalei TaxID=544730 RepID=A0A833QXW1_9POAL|nr:myb-related protein A-like protein [Carex littledalei]